MTPVTPPVEPTPTPDQGTLTGDCSEDCLERCAYPAQFSECATPDQPECGATCTGCSLCA